MRALILALALAALAGSAGALETDRQQPLEVNADTTDGTLGDGITTLRGNVDIRQGTLHILADQADVDKVDGKVRTITLTGAPASLEQEIEEAGLVKASAAVITYRVGEGVVNLQGNADVQHPQYQISGEDLTYDLNKQHFEGTGEGTQNGRIRIQLEPEGAPDIGISATTDDKYSRGAVRIYDYARDAFPASHLKCKVWPGGHVFTEEMRLAAYRFLADLL